MISASTQPTTSAAFFTRAVCAGAWSAAAVVAVAPVLAWAAPETERVVTATGPAFVHQPFFADNTGTVHEVRETSQADLVLVAGGYDSGFRNGMVCLVRDADGEWVAEVLLVEVRNECAAALILELREGRVIEPGHAVVVKTITF